MLKNEENSIIMPRSASHGRTHNVEERIDLVSHTIPYIFNL